MTFDTGICVLEDTQPGGRGVEMSELILILRAH
jgi:hypothetical protein